MCVCECFTCKSFFLLFSKRWKTQKIQRFSRQLHKIKFEPFLLCSPIVSSRLKKTVAGPKKKNIHTFNHQLSNNYLDEEIRSVFFFARFCSLCGVQCSCCCCVLNTKWEQMDSEKIRYFWPETKQMQHTQTHIFNRRTHSYMRCDVMWCDEKYKKSMGKQFGTRSRNTQIAGRHIHRRTEMQFTSWAAVVDRFFVYFFMVHGVTFSDFWRILQLNFAINFKMCASIICVIHLQE